MKTSIIAIVMAINLSALFLTTTAAETTVTATPPPPSPTSAATPVTTVGTPSSPSSLLSLLSTIASSTLSVITASPTQSAETTTVAHPSSSKSISVISPETTIASHPSSSKSISITSPITGETVTAPANSSSSSNSTSTTPLPSAQTVSAKSTVTVSTITTTLPTTTTTVPNYCESDPSSVCSLKGPITCSQNGSSFVCDCVEGYHNVSNNCVVESFIFATIHFDNATATNTTKLADNIQKWFDNNISPKVSTYLYTNVSLSEEHQSGDNVGAAVTEGISYKISITVYNINTSGVDLINATVSNYILQCNNDSTCFGSGSTASYKQDDNAGPCNKENKLCSDYVNTECYNNLDSKNTDVQYECSCKPGINPTSTFYANGAQVYNCPPIRHCNANPCKHSGTCSELLDVDGYSCKCPWTYMGSSCDNPLPLAMVIVACILGALLLLCLVGLIYSIVKSNKAQYSTTPPEERWMVGGKETTSKHGVKDGTTDTEGYENADVNIPRPRVEGYRKLGEEHSHF